MAINRRRDFKKLSVCIKEFLSKLPCDETTGFLRDTLYLSLLELHKYYVKEKGRFGASLPRQASYGPETTLADVLKTGRHDSDKYQSRWFGYDDSSKDTESRGFLAAQQADMENVEALVHSDDADPIGQTYLMYAVHGNDGNTSNQLECIKYIISLNFDINSQANDGATALHVASQYQQKPAIVELLNHQANPRIKDNKGRTALHWAAMASSTDITKILLQYGADVNAEDCDAMTPMMWACHSDRAKNMHLLKNAYERLDPTPDGIFNDRDKDGKTVLHWAVPQGNNPGLDCLKDLLRRDVSHIRDNQGRTVLHTAAKEGCVPACELIVSVCGKEMLHMKDDQNQTALHLATLCGHGETVDFLLQCGANISGANNNGRTALQEAEFGHYHYCLLVFAAFEQIKCGELKDDVGKGEVEEINEVNDKKEKRYESWVIPNGFLHDSQDIPDANPTASQIINTKPANGELAVAQDDNNRVPGKTEFKSEIDGSKLVDVSEIKGFEVEDDYDDDNENTKENKGEIESNGKRSPPRLKSNSAATLQRSKRVEEEKKDEVEDQDLQKHDEREKRKARSELDNDDELSVTSIVSSENDSISENIEVSSLGNDSDDEEEEECKDSDGGTKDVKTDTYQSQAKSAFGVNKRAYIPETKLRRGNLAPIHNPLTQPSLAVSSKLNPIPLPRKNGGLSSSKDSENIPPVSRSIVAPLQPSLSVGREIASAPIFQETKPLSSETTAGSPYSPRGPGHGPLAQDHGKALLGNILQDSGMLQHQKTPETQRKAKTRTNQSAGRSPHPPRY